MKDRGAVGACSIPFGIKDRGAQNDENFIRRKYVLNAFRHQRSWRPHSCKVPFTLHGWALLTSIATE